MEKKLTTEDLKKRFPSQFELVGYAISLADNMVHSGRGPRIRTTNENPAVIVLDEINEGKDILDPLPEADEIVESVSVYAEAYAKDDDKDDEKPMEKKPKARRILQES
ncbi:MAG: hypothetical protein KDK62_00320 [Chlamydiia bacterium]|nr:hypothetical protein [Chlamydiia bacterium]